MAGKPLKRPPWYFDVTQQGEGIVDVTTHLVDLVQWECFPEQALDWKSDINVLSARRWATKLSAEQFNKVTALSDYPEFMKKDVDKDGSLKVFANGEINYALRGVHARVSVTWNFQAPEGTQDTHYSMMRGSRANLIIKQGKEQNYRPVLYVENKSDASDAQFEEALKTGLQKLAPAFPEPSIQKADSGWQVIVPEKIQPWSRIAFWTGYRKVSELPERRQIASVGNAEYDCQVLHHHQSLRIKP